MIACFLRIYNFAEPDPTPGDGNGAEPARFAQLGTPTTVTTP